MVWITLLMMGGLLVLWSRQVTEEVHTLAVKATSMISFIWGFSWAPPSAQVLLASLIGSMVMLRR
ncbi:MAG: hypothetical protein AAF215_35005 [Cyanobacteria bacterium P01_A01_bin.123]